MQNHDNHVNLCKDVIQMNRKLKLLWEFLYGNKMLYVGAIIAVALSTLISMLPPLVIRFTIDSIIGGQKMQVPIWVQSIVDAIGGKNVIAHNLWICGALVVGISIGNGFFLYVKGRWGAIAAESTAQNIRNKLYDHLQELPYNYHVKAETGDLIQRCTSDVETIRRFLANQFVEIGRAVFTLIFAFSIMLSLNVQMTLISMAIVPFIFVFSIIFFMKIQSAFRLSDEAEGQMSNVLQENLTGVRVVRAFGRQAFENDKFEKKNSNFRDLTYRLIRLMAWFWSTSDLMIMFAMGIVLVTGVYWTVSGAISLGTLVVFTSYEGMLLWPVRQMGRILADMGKSMVSLNRIDEILRQPIDPKSDHEGTPNIDGDIEWKNVNFEYESNRPILQDISFTAKKGQTIAILGPTGSGKSSLVHLMQRLYDYKSGSITVGGVELKDIDKKWLRKNIGIVLQEPFLFSKSIKENIAIAVPNAQEEEIFTAAEAACVHTVINEFDNGYDTTVGEKGVTLSGGQKQRVAIARALIRKTGILIFDDSLSAVDTETDAAIRDALKERSRDVTTFIISHRITTLCEADLILVLEHGRLVQSGTHEELVGVPGLYKRIWDIQGMLEQDMEEDMELETISN